MLAGDMRGSSHCTGHRATGYTSRPYRPGALPDWTSCSAPDEPPLQTRPGRFASSPVSAVAWGRKRERMWLGLSWRRLQPLALVWPGEHSLVRNKVRYLVSCRYLL